MVRRKVVPYYVWSDEKLQSINVDWSKIEAVLSRSIAHEDRADIAFNLRFFAAGRHHFTEGDRPKDIELKIEKLKGAIKIIKNVSELDEFQEIRLALSNKNERFDWLGLRQSIIDLSDRVTDCEKQYKSWAASKPIGLGHFHMFVSSCRDFFIKSGLPISAHKNNNRRQSTFVEFCWVLMESLPLELREHASSKITFATEVARSLSYIK